MGLDEAIRRGLAPDGGLYLPTEVPRLPSGYFHGAGDLASVAARWLEPFAAGSRLAGAVGGLAAEALAIPAPLVAVADRTWALELWHGPTAAFKDVGARFLAEALGFLRAHADPPVTVLVATSGDTGGAVAAAFHRRPGFRVGILFPKGLVSPTQERQLTCWDDNVVSCAVRGTFDDCQRLAKAAFQDQSLAERFRFTSANSINIGRLLPQAAYYAAASLMVWGQCREPLSFVIPSGNLGNAFGAVLARAAGLPIGDIVLAHNRNRPVVDFLETGVWNPRPSVPTIASAMDVGDPSNFERFRSWYPAPGALARTIWADSVDDEAIRARIRGDWPALGRVWCPNTATAAEVLARLRTRGGAGGHWAIVATAHPAKFPEVVEPLVGHSIERPASLAGLFGRPARSVEIDPTIAALAAAL